MKARKVEDIDFGAVLPPPLCNRQDCNRFVRPCRYHPLQAVFNDRCYFCGHHVSCGPGAVT